MASATGPEPTQRVIPARPLNAFDRLFIVVLATVGAMLGLAPVCLMIRRLDLLPLIGLGAMVVSALVAWGELPGDRLRPRPFDRVLGAVSAVYPLAILGFLLMIIRAALTWGVGLLNQLLAALDVGLQLPAERIGTGAALLFLLVGGLGFVSLSTKEIGKQLYPLASERRVSGFALLTRRKRFNLAMIFFTVVLLVAYMVVQMWSDPSGYSRHFVLQLALMTSSMFVWGEVRRANREAAAVSANQSVEDLVRTSGFEVEKPPAGDELAGAQQLHGADFIAHGDERHLLVQVRAGDPEPVNWTAISALGTAAWAVAKERELRAYEIEPVLVLVDSQEQVELPTVASEEGVKLLRITHNDILTVLHETEDASQRRAAARRLLASSVVRKMGD